MGGADEIVGTLTFGVGTAANNRIGGFQVLRLNADGFFTTRYHGATLPKSYIDSGTETYILADDLLPRCAGMRWAFCVAPARTLEATLVGTDGGTIQMSFMVGDYRNALDRSVGAWDGFAELADGSSRTFVWGRPSSSAVELHWCSTAKRRTTSVAHQGPFMQRLEAGWNRELPADL